MLKQLILLPFAMLMVWSLSACFGDNQMKSGNTAVGTTGVLVGLLTSQLGVSKEQALGGAGAIFSAAQNNMSADNFGSLAKSVPGMDSMLSAVPAVAAGGGNDMIATAFNAVGMNSGMLRQFMPVILGYVQNQGGNDAMGMLQSALL